MALSLQTMKGTRYFNYHNMRQQTLAASLVTYRCSKAALCSGKHLCSTAAPCGSLTSKRSVVCNAALQHGCNTQLGATLLVTQVSICALGEHTLYC
jgi:hypothetical protein